MTHIKRMAEMTEFAVEIDFLVAQRKLDAEHYAELPDSRIRWSLEKDHPDPVSACVVKIAEMIDQFGFQAPVMALGGLAYAFDYPESDDASFTVIVPTSERDHVLPRESYWVISPSKRAAPREGSPDDYNWIPLTLRSPYRAINNILPAPKPREKDSARQGDASGSSEPPSPPIPAPGSKGRTAIERVMGMIRAGVKIHVNSTCEARIFLNHRRDGFDHFDAKKMLTICWLQEPHLFLALRPEVSWEDRERPRPFTQCSAVAKTVSNFPDTGYDGMNEEQINYVLDLSRPFPPPDGDIMDNFLPQFINPLVKEKIQHIWGAQSLEELSKLIECETPGIESAIAINLHGPHNRPSFELRYALWHPQKESLQHWLQLFGTIFIHAAGLSASRFKSFINVMQNSAIEVQKHDKEDQWKTMITHGFDNVFSYYWDQIKQEYREGGVLSPQALDRQGIVPMIEGFDYDSQLESDESTSSSD